MINSIKIKNQIIKNLKNNKTINKNKVDKKNKIRIQKIFQWKLDYLKELTNLKNIKIYNYDKINENKKFKIKNFLNKIRENPKEILSKLIDVDNLTINNLFIIYETILNDVINHNKLNKYYNLYQILNHLDTSKFNDFSIINNNLKNLEKIFFIISKKIDIKIYFKKIIQFIISKFDVINLYWKDDSDNSSLKSIKNKEFDDKKNKIILNKLDNKIKTLIINENNSNYNINELKFQIKNSNKEKNNSNSNFETYLLEISKFIIKLTKKYLPNEIKIFFTILKEKYYLKNKVIFKKLINCFLFKKLLLNMISDNFYKIFIIEKNWPNFNKNEFIKIIKLIIYKIKNDEYLFLILIEALNYKIENLKIINKNDKNIEPFSYFFYSLDDLYQLSIILKNEEIIEIINHLYNSIISKNKNSDYLKNNLYFTTIIENKNTKIVEINKKDLNYNVKIINELFIYFNAFELEFSNKTNFLKKLNEYTEKNYIIKENNVIKKKLYYIINDEENFKLFEKLYWEEINLKNNKINKLNLKINYLITFKNKFKERCNYIIKSQKKLFNYILKDKFIYELFKFCTNYNLTLNLYKKGNDYEKIYENEDYLITEKVRRRKSWIINKIKSKKKLSKTILINWENNKNYINKVYLEFDNIFEFFNYIKINKIFKQNLKEKKNKLFFKFFKKFILQDYFILVKNELNNYDKNFIYKNYIKFISICFNSFIIKNHNNKFNTFNDYLFYTNCKVYNFLEIKEFLDKIDINLNLFNCNLYKFQNLNSFYDKMKSIKKYQSSISQTLEIFLKDKAIGNEQIFPISLKLLINEKPKNFISNYKLIKLFLNDKLKNGIEGFLLTQLKALINMIQNFNHNNFNINKNLFNELILKNEIELSTHFKKRRKSNNKKKIVLKDNIDILM